MSLRLGASTVLLHLGIAQFSIDPAARVPNLMAALAGFLLLAGLWTPIAGVLIAADELWIAFFRPGDPWIHLMMLALVAGLSMLGPGAWSVDSRLFGRKRFDMSSRFLQTRSER